MSRQPTLELNFANQISSDVCLAELRLFSPIDFTVSRKGGTDIRDILTKPDVKDQVIIKFNSMEDAHSFTTNDVLRAIFQKHSQSTKTNT